MIKLLGRQTSGNVQKVIFCLEELRVPYVREDYGRQFGNTLTDDYRKLNPTAKVPALVDGDVVIWESHTILRYLAAKHGPSLTGATPAERTMVERWMDFCSAPSTRPMSRYSRTPKSRRPSAPPISRRRAPISSPSSRFSTAISPGGRGSRSIDSPSPTWRSAPS